MYITTYRYSWWFWGLWGQFLPKWLSPSPKGNQWAYESFSSVSFFSMMVWRMVEVTSPLHDPTAIIPHAIAVIPTTWWIEEHMLMLLAVLNQCYTTVSYVPPCWIWNLPWQEEAEKGHLLCWSQRRLGPDWNQDHISTLWVSGSTSVRFP